MAVVPVEDLSRSARIAFLLLTALNACVLVGAVATALVTRVGDAGYLLAIVAAPLASPALIALPWFDAWARDGEVSERVLLLWAIWAACLVPLIAIGVQSKLRRRSRVTH